MRYTCTRPTIFNLSFKPGRPLFPPHLVVPKLHQPRINHRLRYCHEIPPALQTHHYRPQLSISAPHIPFIPHTKGPHFSFALLLLNRSSPPYLNLTTPGLTSEPPSLPSAHPPPLISPSNFLKGCCGFTSGECEDGIVSRERQDAGLGPRAGGGRVSVASRT